jgi:hypothetical protein
MAHYTRISMKKIICLLFALFWTVFLCIAQEPFTVQLSCNQNYDYIYKQIISKKYPIQIQSNKQWHEWIDAPIKEYENFKRIIGVDDYFGYAILNELKDNNFNFIDKMEFESTYFGQFYGLVFDVYENTDKNVVHIGIRFISYNIGNDSYIRGGSSSECWFEIKRDDFDQNVELIAKKCSENILLQKKITYEIW